MVKYEGNLVVPGEVVAVIEEFLPSLNVYEVSGNVIAKVVGLIKVDMENKELTVEPLNRNKPLLPSPGDTVRAMVTSIRSPAVVADIFEIEGKGNLSTPLTGVLYVPNISTSKVRDIYEVMRVGDVIRAKIIKGKAPPYLISTKGKEYGVILAFCPHCLKPLTLKGYNLYCKNCKLNFKRKVSLLYMLK
ncbi:MAG: hypothetical protein B6U69_03830 [Thermofilum sp. ex4484_15]|nr:MAG: hypothetical protein B6U69_03830 [Thermofilum sp. ex4484_15]